MTTELPPGLAANPRLSLWVRVDADGTLAVQVGKVEIGQGIVTALAQIAADELGVGLDQLRMVPAATTTGPDEGLTAGSLSIQQSGAALRQACAEVRALFAVAAANRLGVDDPGELVVRDGTFTNPAGAGVTYGELAAEMDLDRDATGTARPGPSGGPRLVGTSVERLDLLDKVTGRPRYVHDLVLPGQLHGRVVRPPSPAATLLDVDTGAVEAAPGVAAVVCDGRFLGVVAADEESADRAAEQLRESARWKEDAGLPDEDDVAGFLRAGPVETSVVAESETEAPAVPRRLAATYSRPFLAHASMAPSCAVARWDEDAVTVWCHSQGIHRLRDAIAEVLDLGDTVDVNHVEGAGCYGHNGADDVAFDAVLLARAVPGRPVRVLWSRHDELTWSPFGSAMSIDVAAGLDASGMVVDWSYDVWSQGHTSRPGAGGSPGLLAAAHLERPHPLPVPVDPSVAGPGGTSRNAVPLYEFPRRRIRAHRALRVALRSSALRSLGAFTNVFAIESFMDELALAVGRDPLDYRLAHLTDPRARAVVEAAADRAGWPVRDAGDGVGHGIGFARYKNAGAYCAVVAEIEAIQSVRVRRLTIAVDVGTVVNPDGARNQVEGGAVQATSWTLKERVRFDTERVTSGDWETYPILRFTETPDVDVHLVDRQDEPPLGVGEAAQGPTAAAIGNAVTDALAVRVRDLPITPERIMTAIEHAEEHHDG